MALENSDFPNEGSSNGIIYLNISLYFAILAFFVVLNALSSSNTEKTNQVASLVKKEFSENDLQKELSFDISQNQTTEPQKNLTFKDTLSGFIDSQKEFMRLDLSENKIFYTLKVRNIYLFSRESGVRDHFNKFSRSLSDFIIKNQKQPGAYVYATLRFNKSDDGSYTKTMKRLAKMQKMLDSNMITNIRLSAAPTSHQNELEQITFSFGKNDF